MPNDTYYRIALGAVFVAVVGVLVYVFVPNRASAPQALLESVEGTSNQTATSSTSTPSTTRQFTRVKVALLDTQSEGGMRRGCDSVVMVDRDIPATPAPLSGALKELFALQDENIAGQLNFIARTKSTLSFEKATIVNGVANIYLTGSLSGLAGVCDDPRASTQIIETAKQFASVKSVQLFLNGKPTTLVPDER